MTRSKTALACASALLALAVAEAGFRWKLVSGRENGVFEIYAVGESSAYGQPYGPELAFPELVREMFDGSIEGRRIVVRNLARRGDTIYPQLAALEHELRLRDRSNPAVVLVYSGHNESFEPSRPRSTAERLYEGARDGLSARSLLASTLIVAIERKLDWRGLRDFAAYDRRLRRLVEASRQSGALPLLATLASNVRGVEPNVDCPARPEGPGRCADAIAAVGRGLAREAAGRPVAAVRIYEAALPEAGGMRALLHYRLAKCREARGEAVEARRLYALALEEDPGTRFGRAKARLNENLRRTAREFTLPLVDAAAELAARSPGGVVGPELMADGHHLNIDGALLLAEGFAREIARAFSKPAPHRLDAEAAFRRAGFGPQRRADAFNEAAVWLLHVSLDHPFPEGRLVMAERSFRAALALAPASLEAHLGLGMTLAARRAGLSKYTDTLDLLVFPRGCALDESVAELAPALRGDGVPETVLRAAASSSSVGCASQRGALLSRKRQKRRVTPPTNATP